MTNASVSQRRTSWGLLLLRILIGWVFLAEGIHSRSAIHGSVRGRRRDRVRGAAYPWSVHCVRCPAIANRYSGCDRDNQGSDVFQAGVLGCDARGTDRLLHACWARRDCPSGS